MVSATGTWRERLDRCAKLTCALTAFTTILAMYLAATAAAAQPVKLGWSDLIPELPPLVDPLDKLTFEQRFELESVLWVRQLSEKEKEERADIVAEANGYEKALKAAGVSI
ncbi:MAG: hypothetical protein AAGF46_11010, partial [Pseudomonadota bacterium]